MNDDPKEVLALLNSLGFVGITAQQLKGFMKDLKLYRKVKERERQQRKEDIRKKIISKQQNMIKEILQEQNKEFDPVDNIASSDSSDIYLDDSLVQVRIRCFSDEKKKKEQKRKNDNYLTAKENIHPVRRRTEQTSTPKRLNFINLSCDSERANHPSNKYVGVENVPIECFKKPGHVESKKVDKQRHISLETRPKSAPNLLDRLEEAGSTQTQTVSTRTSSHSRAKSFIRPWRLQPDAQKGTSIKKSDPVILYQKYQQEWKQMSFPGEAKHANLRWSIREKMLGADPHPLPLPKKASSMPILRKK